MRPSPITVARIAQLTAEQDRSLDRARRNQAAARHRVSTRRMMRAAV